MFGTQNWRLGFPAPDAIRPFPPYPLFVDTVVGNDLNPGTRASPLKSATAALAKCAGLAAPGMTGWKLSINAPESAPLRVTHLINSSFSIEVEGTDGVDWYSYGSIQVTSGWTSLGGGIWSQTLTGAAVPNAVVTTMAQTIGDRSDWKYKLLQTLNTDQTQPGEGEFGWVQPTMYVKLPGSESPNAHTLEINRINTGFQTIGFGQLTVRNMFGRYFNSSGCGLGLSTQPTGIGFLTVDDSQFEYCGLGGVASAGKWESMICRRVVSYRMGDDGFGVHAPSGGGAHAQIFGCTGSYNGDRPGDSSQGASNHENTILDIYGGTFNFNVSGGYVGIDSAICNLIGDDPAWGVITMDHNMRLGNTPGPVSAQAGAAWLNNASGSARGIITISNGGGDGVKVNTTGIVTGAHLIKSFGNAGQNYVGV